MFAMYLLSETSAKSHLSYSFNVPKSLIYTFKTLTCSLTCNDLKSLLIFLCVKQSSLEHDKSFIHQTLIFFTEVS